MLDDLDHGVDRTGSKLSDAMRRMRKFVRETEGQVSLALDRGFGLLKPF
jgi:syntaxin 6